MLKAVHGFTTLVLLVVTACADAGGGKDDATFWKGTASRRRSSRLLETALSLPGMRATLRP